MTDNWLSTTDKRLREIDNRLSGTGSRFSESMNRLSQTDKRLRKTKTGAVKPTKDSVRFARGLLE